MWEVYLPYKKSSTYICQPNQLTLFSCTEIKFNVHFIGTQILRQKGILTRQRKLSMSTLVHVSKVKKTKKTKEMEIRSIKVMQLMCYDGQGPASCGWVGGVIEDTCKIV